MPHLNVSSWATCKEVCPWGSYGDGLNGGGGGALIAVDDSTGEIVGVNFYSDAPSDTQVKHPLTGVASSLQGFQEDGRIDEAGYPIRFDNSMMYRPMAVADHASGKDLARKLIEGMVPIAQQRADARIISCVDNA